MSQRIAPEAALDRAKWGNSPWAPGKTFDAGVSDLLNQFVGPRRRHWYVTHSITNTARPIGINSANNAGIPLAQPPDVAPTFADVEFNPASASRPRSSSPSATPPPSPSTFPAGKSPAPSTSPSAPER